MLEHGTPLHHSLGEQSVKVGESQWKPANDVVPSSISTVSHPLPQTLRGTPRRSSLATGQSRAKPRSRSFGGGPAPRPGPQGSRHHLLRLMLRRALQCLREVGRGVHWVAVKRPRLARRRTPGDAPFRGCDGTTGEKTHTHKSMRFRLAQYAARRKS
eukprot:gene10647-biopygen18320